MKLSDLIEDALHDALALHAQDVTLDMDNWFVPGNNLPCTVCLAGAYLIRTLEKEPKGWFDFSLLPIEQKRQLTALDTVRRGHLWNAVYDLTRVEPPAELISELNCLEFFDNELEDVNHFKLTMQSHIKRLRELQL